MSIGGCSGAEEELEELLEAAVSMAAEEGFVVINGRLTRLFLLQPPPTGTFLRVPPLVQ